MKNEEISDKTIQFAGKVGGKAAVKVIKITSKSVTAPLKFIAKHGIKGLKTLRQNHKNRGEQSYKSIYRSGQSLTNVNIEKEELKVFRKIAKKWGMDFAVKKDKSTKEYALFFKAKDQEIYDKVFSQYRDYLKRKKPSLIKNMEEKKTEIEQQKKLEREKSEAEKQKNSELDKPKEQLPELNKGDNGMTL